MKSSQCSFWYIAYVQSAFIGLAKGLFEEISLPKEESMIVTVTTNEGEMMWQSGKPGRQGAMQGYCCGQNDLVQVIDELQSALCCASRLRGSCDDSYRVPDLCCGPAEVNNDIPVPSMGHKESCG